MNSGHSRISKKDLDKFKGQNRRNWSAKREKKARTNKRKHMVSFFSILVGLEHHKPLSGADTVADTLKLKYIIINIIGDNKGSLINLNWRKSGAKKNDLALVDQTTDHFCNG